MRFFVPSVGKFLIAISLTISAQARASDPEYLPAYESRTPWTKIGLVASAAAISSIAIAQLNNSELIFAGLYGASALYYAVEFKNFEDSQYEDFIVPVSFITLGILNLTLLQQEDSSPSTIAGVNIAGLALLGAYWYHFERHQFRFAVTDRSVHFAFEF